MMTLPFRRQYVRAATNPYDWSGPIKHKTLRQGQVEHLLCPLSSDVRQALAQWLLEPTNLWRWPWPETFEPRRPPFDWQTLRDASLEERGKLLRAELQAIRQTLDRAPDAISGLTRNGLLVAHGRRLRQVEWLLGQKRLAQMITTMIA